MRTALSIVALCLACLAASGCSTIKKNMAVTSTPSGARVVVTTDTGKGAGDYGQTPFTKKFIFGKKPKAGPSVYNLEFTADGYLPKKVSITKDFLGRTLDVALPHEVRRNVKITSVPVGASIHATADRNGPTAFLIGQTPFDHTFVFDTRPNVGPSMFNVEFTAEGYEPNVVTVRMDYNEPELHVVLNREVVKEIQKRVLVVSEEKGYTLEIRKVRAWIEDIEREGMAASSIVRLAGNQSVLGMAISPDSTKLYFSIAEPFEDDKGQEKLVANLRAVNTTGGGITQITSGQWLDTYPSCSADGKHLFFNSNRMQTDTPDIFRISSEKTLGGVAVIRQTVEGANYQPSVGKDGVVSFTYKPKYRGRFSGTEHIWTLGGAASYPTQLREGSMSSISPDSGEIAFIGEDQQLWKMPVTGQTPVQLTTEAVQKEGKKNPTWSPDGRFILFSSDVGRDSRDVPNYDIWMISSDGGLTTQLTTNGSDDDYAVVSPDQAYIYFVSNRGFKEGIWRIPFPESAETLSPQSVETQ